MQYDVFLWTDDKHVLAEFPDCPGCQTFVGPDDFRDPSWEARLAPALADATYEALNGWLEAHLTSGQVPPRPVERTNAPEGKSLSRVPVRPGLAVALLIRWARHDFGLSQRDLGRKAGVSQQQIAKLEDPDENPTLSTIDKVGRALGLNVSVSFNPQGRYAVDMRPIARAQRPRSRARAAATRGR